ncbi:MAG: DUF2785 domain-containing protein [Lysobacterales bacterium]
MRRIVLLMAMAAGAAATHAACPPEGYDREQLTGLRDRAFALEDSQARNALALRLLDCLGDPDPLLRDGVAFEALSAWLRADRLSLATRRALLKRLLRLLDSSTADAAGFRRPFAALVMSELVRTDRIAPWLDAAQREALVAAAARYLISVDDYRGFDDAEGWRHGVAHGADLLLQLVLNPSVDAAQIERLLAAVAGQVAPAGTHFYVYGEAERLVRPVLSAALRETRTDAQWQDWFAAVAAPAPLPDWRAAFQSRAGLARRHNVRAFLSAIYIGASDGDPKLAVLAPMARARLLEIP